MKVAIIGTGVIGAAWAAGFLHAGHEVWAFDPAPGAEARLRDQVRRYLETIGTQSPARTAEGDHGDQSPGSSSADSLRFAADISVAVEAADFVQENGPERLEVKQRLLAEIAAACDEQTIIASSTSGFTPSEISSSVTRDRDRVLVGHPFNPAHLIPLVEVVPRPEADAQYAERAMAIYAAIGKKPILVRAELPGHVTNRLQAALWQEAYSLVERGVASVEDIDTAISYGPGLRWAVLGPLAIQHLSGGPGGMRHLLDHLGPPQEVWMHDLARVHLGEELKEKLIAGVDAEVAGYDEAAMTAQRDEMLLELIDLKRRFDALP